MQIFFVKPRYMPSYAHDGDAGADIRASLAEPMTIEPHKWKAVPTGLFANIPYGYEIQIRPRSGLAFKNGITVLNTPGTIDCNYRGEIKVILINHSDKDFIVEDGDRIAQMVVAPVTRAEFGVADAIEETVRGEGGFGSTGVK